MKKFIFALAFLFTLGASAQTTPTLHLNLPPHGYQPYDVPINANFSIIDQAFTQLLNQYQGVWSNTQAYTQSQIVAFGTAPNTQTYIALSSNSGQEPDTATAFWALLGGAGGGGGGGGGFTLNPSEIGASDGATTPTLTHTNHYVLPTGQTTAQINTFISAHTRSVVEIQNGDARTGFSNPKTNATNTYYMGTKIQDNRTDVNGQVIPVTDKGAACDRRYGAFPVTIANGSTTMTGGGWWTQALVLNKTFVFVTTISGLPVVYTPKVISYTSNTSVTLDTPAPFPITNTAGYYYGQDDTAAIAQAFLDASSSNQANNVGAMAVGFPAGVCMTHNIVMNGVSFRGLDPTLSQLHFFPGDDGFSVPDPSVTATNSGGNGVDDHDLQIIIENSVVDKTLPWQLVANGTTVNNPGVYRPTGVKTVYANNPLSAPWLGTNYANGVASVTSGSPTMTIASSEAVPANGSFLVFPYASGGIFVTTVLSQSGHTVTMNNNYTGTTSAQTEWFTGSSPQKTVNDFPNSGTRTYPFHLQLLNPTYYDPNNETGFAPFGLVQIGNEQCSYFYDQRVVPYDIQVRSCTGTPVDHPIGSYIQPLNPFHPEYPWPVTPTINSGDTTPTLASYYPAFNVGASGFASPVSNGATVSGVSGIFAFSHIHDFIINFTGQGKNSAAGFYMVGLPYKTQFSQIQILNGMFGIEEGVPSINSHHFFAAQPTADATTFDGITIRATNIMDVIGGANTSYSNIDSYSQAGGAPYPISSGAVAGYVVSFGWDDQTGGASQFVSASHFQNLYIEPENPGGFMPLTEFDCLGCEFHNIINHGGGDFIMGGRNNHFYSSNFNVSKVTPLVNYGQGNNSDNTALIGQQPKSNVYQSGSVLNYAPGNTKFSGTTDNSFGTATGPNGNVALGSRDPFTAQTGDTFLFGNLTAPFTGINDGLIYPDEFGSFDAQPTFGYKFDDSAPVSHASVSCGVGTSPVANYCLSNQFNNGQIPVGPGQRLVNGKYTLTISAKDTTATSNTASFAIGTSCTGVLQFVAVPITNNWPTSRAQWTSAQVDLSSASAPGCFLNFGWEGDTTADINSISIVAFTPTPENLAVQNLNIDSITNTHNPSNSNANAVGCYVSPVLGLNQGFTCIGNPWVTTISASQLSTDLTVALTSVSGILATTPGCFEIDSEIECYSSVSGGSLVGLNRHMYGTSAAAHSSSATIRAVLVAIGNPLKTPQFISITGDDGQPISGINTAFPNFQAGNDSLDVNSGGNEGRIAKDGTYHQGNAGSLNEFASAVTIGSRNGGNTNISSSSDLLQVGGLNEAVVPIGLGAGHAGTLKVVPAPTLTAPHLGNFSTGTGATTWTYVCTGTDYDGNLVNGTSASIPNLPATTLTGSTPFISVTCPFTAGLQTVQIYRTAGGPNQGLIYSGAANNNQINDSSASSAGGTAPSSNNSNPSISVQGTSNSGVAFGTASGVFTFTSTPTACGSTYPNSSIGINVNGTTSSNTIYQCNGTTWNSIGSGGGGGVANLLASAETVTFSATPTFSITLNSSEITLTAAITSFTLAAGSQGQVKYLVFCQNATGHFAVTPPANVHALAVGGVPSKCSTDTLLYSNAASAWLLTGSVLDQ